MINLCCSLIRACQRVLWARLRYIEIARTLSTQLIGNFTTDQLFFLSKTNQSENILDLLNNIAVVNYRLVSALLLEIDLGNMTVFGYPNISDWIDKLRIKWVHGIVLMASLVL